MNNYTSNYFSDKFCEKIRSIIDVDEVSDEVLIALDDEMSAMIARGFFCTEECEKARLYLLM